MSECIDSGNLMGYFLRGSNPDHSDHFTFFKREILSHLSMTQNVSCEVRDIKPLGTKSHVITFHRFEDIPAEEFSYSKLI